MARVASKANKKLGAAKDIRSQKLAAGIRLCPFKNCDGAYCKGKFSTLKG
jgi:hypothetical protein